MSVGIRYRLITIFLLGALTSGLSVVALVQLFSTSTSQRIERAREAAIDEAERLARVPTAVAEPATSTIVGLRGGEWAGDAPPATLPADWADPLRSIVHASLGEGGLVVREVTMPSGTLVLAARPLAQAGATTAAWAGFHVRPLASLIAWQRIVSLVVAATVLLVATTLYSVVTLNRSAAALRASLQALATDLRAPIPRSTVRELSDIADGVAQLAEKLVLARGNEERMARELAQNERLAALGRVAAGVAHEVRNPLASIKLRLDLAAASTTLPPAVDEAVTHAVREIDRLDRLVADLLVVAGRATGPRRPARVGDLVRSRLDTLSPWASTREIRLVGVGDAEAIIDGDALARAIDNLVRNAVEASPPGAAVEAHIDEEGEGVVVRVRDAGVGVPAERLAELFEPFFTTKPAGTGLGLALARAIARAHGGDVTYVREGGATRFELTLPRVKPQGDRAAA